MTVGRCPALGGRGAGARRGLAATAVAGAALLAAAAGCGGGDAAVPTTTAPPVREPGPGAVAATVCADLRAWEGEAIDAVNAAAAEVAASDEPARRAAVILGGFDELVTLTASHRDGIADLDLGAGPDADRLRAELVEGADEAVRQLEAERRQFEEEAPVVSDDDERGRVGQFFNALEKAFSNVEPSPRYVGDALAAAFRAEEACEFVVEI